MVAALASGNKISHRASRAMTAGSLSWNGASQPSPAGQGLCLLPRQLQMVTWSGLDSAHGTEGLRGPAKEAGVSQPSTSMAPLGPVVGSQWHRCSQVAGVAENKPAFPRLPVPEGTAKSSIWSCWSREGPQLEAHSRTGDAHLGPGNLRLQGQRSHQHS